MKTMNLFFKRRDNDSDGDFVPDWLDSNPFNPLKQSNPVMQTSQATIPKSLRPPSPKVLTKPPTVQEQKQIQKGIAQQEQIIQRELTPEEIEKFQQEFIEENKTKSLNAIDQEIQKENQRIENVKHRLNVAIREGNQSKISNLREVLDRTIDEAGRYIGRLMDVKSLGQTGQYTPSSLIQYAGSQVAQTLKRVEYKQQARITYQKQVQQYKKEVTKELKGYDMKPVFDEQGNLRGVRDLKTKMSIPIQNLEKYLPERNFYLPRTTPDKKVTTIKTEPAPTITGEVQPVSEKGKEQIKVHKFLEKTGFGLFSNLLGQYEQRGLGGSFVGITSRLTPKAYTWFPEGSRVRNILEKPAPDWSIRLLDSYLKFGLFSGFMAVGGATKGKGKVKGKSEQKVVYNRKFNDLTDKEYSAFVNNLKVNTKRADLREIYRRALNTNDKNIIKNTERILKDTFSKTKEGQQAFKNFIKDVQQQELFRPEGLGRIPSFTKQQPKDTMELFFPRSSEGLIFEGRIPYMRNVERVGAGSGIFSREDTTPTSKILPVQIPKEEPRQEQNPFLNLLTGISIKPTQPQQQPQKLDQPQPQTQYNFPIFRTPQAEIPKFKQPQTTNPVFNTGQPQPPKQETPTKTKPFPIIPFIFSGEKVTKQEDKSMYNVQVLSQATKKPKWIQINTKPQSLRSGLDKGSKYIDEHIGARFRLKPLTQTKRIKGKKKEVLKMFTGKKPKGSGYYNQHAYKFREYRVRKGQKISTPKEFIERSRYRLDHPNETKTIQRERRISDFFGGFGSRKKRKRRFRI